MCTQDWHESGCLPFSCRLQSHDPARAAILLLFNPDAKPQAFTLPAGAWQLLLDSSASLPPTHASAASDHLTAPARSLLVLRSH
jgi:hypothetical protein